jgi:hypothetical protein
MRGNFLAVIGRKESDKKLLSLIEKHYLKGMYCKKVKSIELVLTQEGKSNSFYTS